MSVFIVGPTLKLRRPVVVKKYSATIEAMYSESWRTSCHWSKK